jgi:hypothetical protein
VHNITETTSIKLEALQCNKTNIHKLVENLMVMLLKLTENGIILCKDDCFKLLLKIHNHELMNHCEKYDKVQIQICKFM